MSDTAGSGLANIRRISNDMVDREFTAKQLIGKEVYDNRDKRIGEVKDVVLDTTNAQQLASALRSKASTRTSGTSMTSPTTASSSSTGSSTSPSSTERSSSMSSSPSSISGVSSTAGEPAAIISYGGFMGVGNNLLHVPLSQLRYDSSRDHITVNVSESELSSLKDVSDTSRSAAE